MKKVWSEEISNAVASERLLVVSPFAASVQRITRETALVKNQSIISLSQHLVVGYKNEQGQLSALLEGREYEVL